MSVYNRHTLWLAGCHSDVTSSTLQSCLCLKWCVCVCMYVCICVCVDMCVCTLHVMSPTHLFLSTHHKEKSGSIIIGVGGQGLSSIIIGVGGQGLRLIT